MKINLRHFKDVRPVLEEGVMLLIALRLDTGDVRTLWYYSSIFIMNNGISI